MSRALLWSSRQLTPALFALGLALGSVPASGGEADVLAVRAAAQGDGRYRFDVTVRSNDRGWDYYCDRFEIVAPDGALLGTRILFHPHTDEQPFTRSIEDVAIPAAIERVLVRARMKPGGASGDSVQTPISR